MASVSYFKGQASSSQDSYLPLTNSNSRHTNPSIHHETRMFIGWICSLQDLSNTSGVLCHHHPCSYRCMGTTWTTHAPWPQREGTHEVKFHCCKLKLNSSPVAGIPPAAGSPGAAVYGFLFCKGFRLPLEQTCNQLNFSLKMKEIKK